MIRERAQWENYYDKEKKLRRKNGRKRGSGDYYEKERK